MKTIRIRLETELLEALDHLVAEHETTRSAFIEGLMRAELRRHRQRELERRDAEGYRKHPQSPEEFAVDPKALDWGDPW